MFNSVELSDLGPYICQAYSGQGRPVSMYVTLMAIDNGAVRAEHPEDEPYLQYVVPAPPLPPTHNNYPPTPPPQPPLEQEPNGKPNRAVTMNAMYKIKYPAAHFSVRTENCICRLLQFLF